MSRPPVIAVHDKCPAPELSAEMVTVSDANPLIVWFDSTRATGLAFKS
jgi:hypothetical protein